MAKKLKITRSTPDIQIAGLGEEEILKRFNKVKSQANALDTERDRLRKYVQENIEEGRYGTAFLEKKPGSPRAYANSDGLFALQNFTITDSNGNIVPNETLYTKNAPVTIKITELPPEDEEV